MTVPLLSWLASLGVVLFPLSSGFWLTLRGRL